MDHTFFVHSPRLLPSSWLLWVVPQDQGVCKGLRGNLAQFFGHLPEVIFLSHRVVFFAVSWGISILIGQSESPVTVLYSSSFSTASRTFFAIYFLNSSHSYGVRWNLKTLLICISLMSKDLESFEKYVLFTCGLPFENCLTVYWFYGLFIFLSSW